MGHMAQLVEMASRSRPTGRGVPLPGCLYDLDPPGFKSACKRDRTTLSALQPNTEVFFKALKGKYGPHTQRFSVLFQVL